MNRFSSWLAAFFFLCCLALGYLALHQRTEYIKLDAERSAAEKEERARVSELQRQLVVAKTARAQAIKEVAQLAKGAAVGAQGPRTTIGSNMRTIHISDIIKEHPEYAALYDKEVRRNVIRQYGDVLNGMNLPADEASKIKNLLVERQLTTQDAQQAAEAAGLEQGTPGWRAALQQASQAVEQEITATLGPDGTKVLQQVQAQAGFHSQVEYTYAPDLTDAGVGLTPEQASGLSQAMANASYSGRSTSGRPADYNTPDPTTGLTPHDLKIADEAAQVLSPAQLQVFKTTQAENAQRNAIMRQYMQGVTGGVRIMP